MDKPRSLRKDGFAGTNVSPYEKMALPVQTSRPTNDGFAGTGQAAFPTNDGFAGTGQAAFPTKRWLCRNGTSRVPYQKMASPEQARAALSRASFRNGPITCFLILVSRKTRSYKLKSG